MRQVRGLLRVVLTGLTASTKYYVRAYASNSSGTAYGDEITFTTVVIGSTYQGGKIFYFLKSTDGGYDKNVQHGLIAATADESSGANIGFLAARDLADAATYGGYIDWSFPPTSYLSYMILANTSAALGLSTASGSKYWSGTKDQSSRSAFFYRSVPGNFQGSGESQLDDGPEYYRARAMRSF